MTAACVQGERQGCQKQRSCFSADYPSMSNRGTCGTRSQFLIKKTPLGLFRRLQKTKRREKNPAKQVPHCAPRYLPMGQKEKPCRATYADAHGACQAADALGSELASMAWPLGPNDCHPKTPR